jgi:hypothetical protein
VLKRDQFWSDRLKKIIDLMMKCKFGIHDLSRIQRTNNMPRFNMPFELGVDMGCQRAGNANCHTKNLLILEAHEFRYKQFISDLSGRDVEAHHNHVNEIISIVRDWLNDAVVGSPRHPLPGDDLVSTEYRKFRRHLPDMCKKASITFSKLTYNDFEYLAAKFIKARQAKFKATITP